MAVNMQLDLLTFIPDCLTCLGSAGLLMATRLRAWSEASVTARRMSQEPAFRISVPSCPLLRWCIMADHMRLDLLTFMPDCMICMGSWRLLTGTTLRAWSEASTTVQLVSKELTFRFLDLCCHPL